MCPRFEIVATHTLWECLTKVRTAALWCDYPRILVGRFFRAKQWSDVRVDARGETGQVGQVSEPILPSK
jgi:hypothetical protein